jgi:hypothetical protein
MSRGLSFWSTAVLVLVFAAAMAYLEAAVVVYLTGALGGEVGVIFPLRPAGEVEDLLAIEVGREAATLVIIAAVGALIGRSGLERLAWAAVVFGAWDIGYYAWLRLHRLAALALDDRPAVPHRSPGSASLVAVAVNGADRVRAGCRIACAGRATAAGAGTGSPAWAAAPGHPLLDDRRTGLSMAACRATIRGRSSSSGGVAVWAALDVLLRR